MASSLLEVARSLGAAQARHTSTRDGIEAAVGAVQYAWVSPASRRYQQDGDRFVDRIRPLPQALERAATASEGLASRATDLAAELRFAERELEDAARQQSAIAAELRWVDPQDLGRIQVLEQRQRDASWARQRAERRIDGIHESWAAACRRTEPTLREAVAVVRSVSAPGLATHVGTVGRRAGHLAWVHGPAPFWPFERDLAAHARARRVSAVGLATATHLSRHVSETAMRYIPGRWDRPTHYERRGHWRRTPSGGRTWVRPHQARNPNANWIAAHKTPDVATRSSAARFSRTASRASGVLTVGFATYEQYRDDSLDPAMATSEQVGRAATAGAVIGGAPVAGGWAGGVSGAKVGAAIGATVGSVIPGAGTAVGAAVGGVVGGIVGAVAGSNLAGKAASAFNDNVLDVVGAGGSAVKSATSAVSSAASNVKGTVSGWFGR